jgi:hypothetical protein
LWRSRGSAPLDFILVAFPLVILTISVIGIAMNGFGKNLAQDLAVDTARFAALADQDASLAAARAYRGAGLVIARAFEPNILVTRHGQGGQCSIEAIVTLKPLALGFLTNLTQIKETALAVCELQE